MEWILETGRLDRDIKRSELDHVCYQKTSRSVVCVFPFPRPNCSDGLDFIEF